MKQLTFFLCLFFFVNSYGQDLHDEVTKVFNFYPHKMTSEEQKAIYPKLDSFFVLVTNNRDKYLESLREELKRDDNNPYFYFDGGLLLLEISKTKEDYQLVADALTKTDLNDLPTNTYLNHLLDLSIKGANVVEAALHALDDSTFHVYIPQHALTLNYGEGLKFILPRYQADLYINKLISKFNLINSTANMISCLDLFVYANCCEADDFLLSLKNDNLQPQDLRKKVEETLNLTTVSKSVNDKKYLKSFEKRKEILNRISDEAVYELDDLTLDMRKSYECSKQ